MDAGGFIKLWRSLLHHPIMQHDGLCRLWVYCLLHATWKDAEFLVPGTTNQITILRGSFVTTRKQLHGELYPAGDNDGREMQTPAPYTLWRWLISLERMNCVKLENMSNRCTVVTICNYESYQLNDKDMRSADEQPMSNGRATDEQPSLDKKERRKEIGFTKPTVEEVVQYCLERKNGIDAEYFVAYYDANGWTVGKGNKMKNWKAAITTWEKNDAKRNGHHVEEHRGPRPLTDEEIDRINQEYADNRGIE